MPNARTPAQILTDLTTASAAVKTARQDAAQAKTAAQAAQQLAHQKAAAVDAAKTNFQMLLDELTRAVTVA